MALKIKNWNKSLTKVCTVSLIINSDGQKIKKKSSTLTPKYINDQNFLQLNRDSQIYLHIKEQPYTSGGPEHSTTYKRWKLEGKSYNWELNSMHESTKGSWNIDHKAVQTKTVKSSNRMNHIFTFTRKHSQPYCNHIHHG